MSPEDQRIAIAEACGWKSRLIEGERDPSQDSWTSPPDYLNDLNAMHEAEKTLDYDQRSAFVVRLSVMMNNGFEFCHATAAQRAEAFLRTIGKWQEDSRGDNPYARQAPDGMKYIGDAY